MTIHHKPHKGRFQEPGFYFTIDFVHGDADIYTKGNYFIPASAGNEPIVNFLYLIENMELEGYGGKLIVRLAPTYKPEERFEWPYDRTGWDGRAKADVAEVLYWDGKQLLDCDIEWDLSDVSDEVKDLVKNHDYSEEYYEDDEDDEEYYEDDEDDEDY